MSVGVIIVAGGRGDRMGTARPKQLLDLGGRSILRRSLEAFDQHPIVSHIVVVLPEDLVPEGPALVGATARPCRIVAGGLRRQDSVERGFDAMPPEADVILIHDAARPFASADLIERVVRDAERVGAAVPAVPSRDTVKRVDLADHLVRETIPRDEIWLAQTPQAFRREVLAEAVALGRAGHTATDEAMLVERAGRPVSVVAGDERNIKITTPADLAAARSATGTMPRVGTGYDLHRLAEGRSLVLAGVVVSTDRGPIAHSDGDVLCHAVIDAILGAAGLGDIGQQFPNTDPTWKAAPGLDLLSRALAIVGAQGWSVSSVDATVILERPKLAPYVVTIRQKLAEALGVSVDRAGVKAKTNEGVDAIGRGEAIAAHAVAVLVGEGRAR